jgi:hypothetical protein
MRVSISVSYACKGERDKHTSVALFPAQGVSSLLFGVLVFALSPFLLSRFAVQSTQNHSVVSSFTTSSVITGSWHIWCHPILQPSQKTIILFAGLWPRPHLLQSAFSTFRPGPGRRFGALRFLGGAAETSGTNCVGFTTLRPLCVMLGKAVTDVESSLSSSSPRSLISSLSPALSSLSSLTLFRFRLFAPPFFPIGVPLADPFPDALVVRGALGGRRGVGVGAANSILCDVFMPSSTVRRTSSYAAAWCWEATPKTEVGLRGPPSPRRRLRIISVAAEKGWETKADGPLELFVEGVPLRALALSATSLGSVVVIVFAPQVAWSLAGCVFFFAPPLIGVVSGSQWATPTSRRNNLSSGYNCI